MLIGELSEKTGFSKDTIRFYEKRGLINIEKDKRRDNNYKEYSDNILEQLYLIKATKKLGFTLKEIINILEVWTGKEKSCGVLKNKIIEKNNNIDNEIKLLNNIKSILINVLNNCDDNCQFVKQTPSCISKCS